MTAEQRDSSFPKKRRLLRPAEFRRVYDDGFRISGPYFAAFCLAAPGQEQPRVGFTVPRAIGGSVVRNRLKRRVREAVRVNIGELGREWMIVFNPRRPALEAPFSELAREVKKVFLRCGN